MPPTANRRENSCAAKRRNHFTDSGVGLSDAAVLFRRAPRHRSASHQRAKDGETNENRLDEKENGVELMIALAARDGGDRYAAQKERHTDHVLRP